ncbi:adenylate/guanylate cyclase domain-containing protein [Taibaiella helva]|uniref:adenylate/guanylate cyclase domain-containing protein n=1 Tax=Taibaiella helva TaxID=2301235 RepID=UPI000E58E9EE|nr:adenylate/guanylate cyclase domain-containing protein [Taibaiella helva]
MKRILLLLVCLLPLGLYARETPKTDTLDLGKAVPETVYDGFGFNLNYDEGEQHLWRFSTNDSAIFVSADYDDATWTLHPSLFPDEEMQKRGLAGHTGWLRLRIKGDSAMAGKPVALVFNGNGAMAVYLNGTLIGRAGNFSDKGKGSYVSLSSRPVFFSLPAAGTYVLSVRYENKDATRFEDPSWGFSLAIQRVGVFYHMFRGNLIVTSVALIGVGMVFTTLFLVHFLLFLFYRKEISNLYFALFCLSAGLLLLLLYYGYVSERVFLHNYTNAVVLLICCITSCFSLTAFTVQLFSRKKAFLWIMLGLSAVVTALSLSDVFYNTDYSSTGMLLLVVLSFGYAIVRIVIAIFRRVPGALILGAGVLLFVCTFLVLFLQVIFMGSVGINNLVFLFFVLAVFSIPLSISSYLAWRFAAINKNLSKQLVTVEQLSSEKQVILQNQKESLELEVAERTKEVLRQKKEIEAEKQKSDELLRNILPSEIAEELKLRGESKAQLYDEASVLFTDFVNFTRISEQLGVEELLQELNINFTAFDRIMEKYGLEKIKTIGDAYLAVSGLPVAHPRHAQLAVLAALDILDFVAARKKQVPYGLDIRIGINSGSLIAGIIGVKKFAYDIWGDTVNTAARMEQNSEAGKINISENTYQLIRTEFICVHRGKVGAKHKGDMDMYFVESSIDGPAPVL